MAEDFDLESLVHLEQTFYDSGYADGFAHGRIHGLIEGRALGREKGFEMWEELGFYEGFALMWKAVYISAGKTDSDRVVHHTTHLLSLIYQFPRVNPSAAADSTASELDIPKLFRQIRSRYKLLCSSLGVRPSLRASASAVPAQDQDGSSVPVPHVQDEEEEKGMSAAIEVEGVLTGNGSGGGRKTNKRSVWAVEEPGGSLNF